MSTIKLSNFQDMPASLNCVRLHTRNTTSMYIVECNGIPIWGIGFLALPLAGILWHCNNELFPAGNNIMAYILLIIFSIVVIIFYCVIADINKRSAKGALLVFDRQQKLIVLERLGKKYPIQAVKRVVFRITSKGNMQRHVVRELYLEGLFDGSTVLPILYTTDFRLATVGKELSRLLGVEYVSITND